MAKVSRPFNLSDYFIRLKTTSISSDKYAETLEVLQELFEADLTGNGGKKDSMSVSY